MRKENYYTHMAAVLHETAEDKDHPAFKYGCGNKRTLDKPDSPRKVKEFYDQYYFKSKVNLLTLGDSSKLNMGKIGDIIKKSSENSIMKTKPQTKSEEFRSLKKPLGKEDLFALIDSKYQNYITFIYFIDLEKHQLQALEFLRYVISRNLRDILMKESNIALSMHVDIQYEESFACLQIRIEPTIASRKNPNDLFYLVNKFISGLENFNTFEDFSLAAKQTRTAFYIKKKVSEDMELVGDLNSNYGTFGIKQLFIGNNLLSEYNKKDISFISGQLASSNKYVVMFGDFDKSDHEVSNNITDFFKTQIDRNSISTITSSTPTRFKVDRTIPEYQVSYTFFRLPPGKDSSFLSPVQHSPLLLPSNLFKKLHPNPFSPSLAFLTSLDGYEPQKTFELLSKAPFVQVLNEKYSFPTVNIILRVNIDTGSVSRENHVRLQYFECVLWRRLIATKFDLEEFRSEVKTDVQVKGLIITLNMLPETAHQSLLVLQRALQTNLVTQEEHEYAIDTLRKTSDYKQKPYKDAKDMIERFLFPAVANKDDLRQFVKKNIAWGEYKDHMPAPSIDHVHLEYAKYPRFDPSDARNILSGFSNKKLGFALSTARQFPEKKVLLIRELKSNPSDTNSGYLSSFLMGKNTPQIMGRVALLDRLLNDLAFDYLRNQKALGYVAGCSPSRMDGYAIFGIIVQGDKPISVIENEVENFLQVAENHLKNMTDETYRSAVTTVLEMLKIPFQSPEQEAVYWYKRIEEGFDLNYLQEMKAAQATTTKQEMIDFFLHNFKEDPKRVITESLAQADLNTSTELTQKRYSSQYPLEVILNNK